MDYPLETLSQAQGEEGQLWLEAIHAGMMDIPSGFFFVFSVGQWEIHGKSMEKRWLLVGGLEHEFYFSIYWE